MKNKNNKGSLHIQKQTTRNNSNVLQDITQNESTGAVENTESTETTTPETNTGNQTTENQEVTTTPSQPPNDTNVTEPEKQPNETQPDNTETTEKEPEKQPDQVQDSNSDSSNTETDKEPDVSTPETPSETPSVPEDNKQDSTENNTQEGTQKPVEDNTQSGSQESNPGNEQQPSDTEQNPDKEESTTSPTLQPGQPSTNDKDNVDNEFTQNATPDEEFDGFDPDDAFTQDSLDPEVPKDIFIKEVTPSPVNIEDYFVFEIEANNKSETVNLLKDIQFDTSSIGNIKIEKQSGGVGLEPGVFKLTSIKPLEGSFTISSKDYPTKTINVKFINHPIVFEGNDTFRTGETRTLTVKGITENSLYEVKSNTPGLEATMENRTDLVLNYNKEDIPNSTSKAGSITLTVNGEEVTKAVNIKSKVDALNIITTPEKVSPINSEIQVAIEGTDEELSYEVSDESLVVTKIDNLNYRVVSDKALSGKVTFTGNNVISKSAYVAFRDKKELRFLPHTAIEVSMEKPIVLEVVSLSGEDIEGLSVRSKSGKVLIKRFRDEESKHEFNNLFTITPIDKSESVEDTIIAASTDSEVLSTELNIAFRKITAEFNVLSGTLRARKRNRVEINGVYDTDSVDVTAEDPNLTVKMNGFNEASVTLNKDLGRGQKYETSIYFVVNGEKLEYKMLFIQEYDYLTVNYFPSNRVEYTSEVTMTVEGTENLVNVTSSNASIVVRRVNGATSSTFLVTSNAVTKADLTISGLETETKQVSIDFTEPKLSVPPIEVENTELTVVSTTKVLYIPVANVYIKDLNVKSSSFKLKPKRVDYRNDNVAIVALELSEVIEQPVNVRLTITSGKQVLEMYVNIVLPKEKEHFSVNGMTFDGYVTSREKDGGISFVIPFLDVEKDFICRGVTEEFNSKIDITQSANRVTIRADRVCKGQIVLKHPEYLDSYVTVNFVEYVAGNDTGIIEDIAGTMKEVEKLGLEYNGHMSIPYRSDEFVLNVVSKRNFKGVEKLGYIFAHGSNETKTIIRFGSIYDLNNKPNATFKGSDAVARDNFNLYNVIKNVLYVQDYYMFRERFLLLITMFNTYKDSSLSGLRIYRFEEKWPGSPQDLERYKNITTFIIKYIENHGKGLNTYIKPMRRFFSDITCDNLDKFCSEEIYV